MRLSDLPDDLVPTSSEWFIDDAVIVAECAPKDWVRIQLCKDFLNAYISQISVEVQPHWLWFFRTGSISTQGYLLRQKTRHFIFYSVCCLILEGLLLITFFVYQDSSFIGNIRQGSVRARFRLGGFLLLDSRGYTRFIQRRFCQYVCYSTIIACLTVHTLYTNLMILSISF